MEKRLSSQGFTWNICGGHGGFDVAQCLGLRNGTAGIEVAWDPQVADLAISACLGKPLMAQLVHPAGSQWCD